MNDTNNTDSFTYALKKRIEAARREKGYTVDEFLNALNDSPLRSKHKGSSKYKSINTSGYNAWGRNPVPTVWIPVICDILDCDPGYLFGYYNTYHHSITDASEVFQLSPKTIDLLLKKKNNPYLEVRNLQRLGRTVSEEALYDAEEYEDKMYDFLCFVYTADLADKKEAQGEIHGHEEWEDFVYNNDDSVDAKAYADAHINAELEKVDFCFDRDSLNELISSTFFPDLLRQISDCIRFSGKQTHSSASNPFDETGTSIHSDLRDRIIMRVQWFAGKIADELLSKAEGGQVNGEYPGTKR